MLTIKGTLREGKANNVELRKNGFIPAIFYGPKQKSTAVKFKENEFQKVYNEAGESSIIILDDGTEQHESLIHDVQFDAVSGKPIHADFYVIEKGKKVEVAIPLEYVGQSEAEKTLGGVLVKVLYEIEIEALPKDLPKSILVDISALVDFQSKILIKDLKIPAGVDVKADPEEVVALVQEHKEEVIEEVPVADALASIEVEKIGKKVEEGAPAEAGKPAPEEKGDKKS